MKQNPDISRIVLVATIGLCEALLNDCMTVDEASDFLFIPHTMKIVGYDEELVYIIHKATELEDIESLIPQHLEKIILEIKTLALEKLRSLPDYEYQYRKWLSYLI
ncbi:hypothetical protein Dalk_3508 [Desulfatibacillum aliphaticivorans]|uniref:DUF3969 family protein n=1 Tax=Desulfatibacillum aliphaticivorans TaxID=218208 RepID=B8FBZ1_DESAL|nr:DUF3969 family protein [Desulfatibacillum aliphaticivorans]ACL05196.1 hypothetical protein Dalk_3508 [Desulfatibacillum aliphaticivorans]